MAQIKVRTNKKGQQRYTAYIRIKGHPPMSATFERRTDAKLWAQKVESEIRQGKHFGTTEARRRTVADVVDRYLETVLPTRRSDHSNVKRHLEWWRDQLGAYALIDLKPARIAEKRDLLLTEPINDKGRVRTPATVVRYMNSLSVALSYAVKDWAWLDENPVLKVRKPKEPRGRVRFLSDEERKKLLKACKASESPHLYPVVVLALSTGARLNEIMTLQWSNIDFKRRMMTLEKTKNGERRSIPLAGRAFELLQDLNKVRRIDTPYIFAREDGNKPVEIKKTWDRTIKKIKLTDFKFHDLRHTTASYLAMEGATLLEIAAVLGHKTLAMVKRYSHLTEQHTAKVLERINQKQFEEEDGDDASESA